MYNSSAFAIAGLLSFSSTSRLYEFHLGAETTNGGDDDNRAQSTSAQLPSLLRFGSSGLLVEGFVSIDSVDGIGCREVILLSSSATIELKQLLGQPASLATSLADGSRCYFSGVVQEAAKLGAEGGFARYRLRLVPWLWLLTQNSTSRVWQEQSLRQIIDDLLAPYVTYANWQWSDEVAAVLDELPLHSYCVQYRESDYQFLSRLLSQAGLSWRVEEADADAAAADADAQRMSESASTSDGTTTTSDELGDVNTSNNKEGSAASANPQKTQRVVFFFDSTDPQTIPEDRTSRITLGGRGIRFHGARAREAQDSIQSLNAQRRFRASVATVLSTDYKAKQAVAASVPSAGAVGGVNAPVLESYDVPGAYAFVDTTTAERAALLRMEALEAQDHVCTGLSTVRSLRAGSRFSLSQAEGALGSLGSLSSLASSPSSSHSTSDPSFFVVGVSSVGINNLPTSSMEASAALFGALPKLLEQCWHDAQAWSRQWSNTMNEIENEAHSPISAERNSAVAANAAAAAAAPFSTANAVSLVHQAQALGYANQFFALPLALPWRNAACLPIHQLNQLGTSWGSQTAIVIGAQGETVPQGEEEIYCDRLGRIRIRFHWQDWGEQDHASASPHSNATCWVRVAQRSAGAGMGMQFLPRIGQEVLVQFVEGDVHRPIVVGALYNGLGEGGVVPTPGGQPNAPQGGDASDVGHDSSKLDQTKPFAAANDHRSSAQGNLVRGNSPVWHGAASQSNDAGGHNNAAAITGIRSKEMGGAGFNQLLFDDTDSQSRIQLKTTQAATELNMGHLIHMADNYRGSFRGLGAELRTDAYGALRAGAGWLITSEGIQHQANQRDAAGDNTAGMAHVKQAVQMAKQLQQAASTHQTVGLAGITTKPTPSSVSSSVSVSSSASSSAPSATSAAKDSKGTSPLESLQQAVAGMVGELPHTTAPIIAVTGKAGIGMTAAQDVQWSVGDVASVMTGQGTQLISGGQFRAHSGQAIGILSGVVDGGSNAAQSNGLQLIAAQGKIQIEAHSNDMKVQAKQDINIMSSHAHIDWAAAKSISLSTEGGANITIKDGNITVQCPGKILLQAGQKSFLAAERLDYKLPVMPSSIITPETERRLESTFALDQLTRAAKASTKLEFVALVVPIFGIDIPATTYIKLYDRLRNGAIPNAKIVLMSGGYYPAAFDNETREIRVHRTAAERAVKNNDESWELLMALLHEFGHYVDAVLRQDLADKNADGTSLLARDAPGDEGAKFAYEIANFDWEDGYQKPFATYMSPEFSGTLKFNYNAARQAIQLAQGDEAQRKEGKSGSLEHFGAGRGEHAKENPESSFGHQSIEDGLINSSKIFTGTLGDAVRKQIYFGNWLRDFSQVLDPKIVRPKGLPKDLGRYLSREALTKLVALKAEIEFGENPADRKLFAVTPEILGVYRPVEHIDNPTNNDPKAVDPRTINPGFDPLPTPESLKVDPTTSMKRYIADSREYMRSQMNKAAAAGRTPQGYREFGAGLHVLEDYFAHSNFVELSLRKLGHTNVLPWTSQAPGKHPFPLVTGMFDSEDVIASTFGMIADTLFKVKWEFQASKPGERTPSDRAMLILLDEHSDPTYLKRFQQYLLLRDKWASVPGHQYLEGAMHYTIGMVGNLYNFVYNSLLHLIANSVSDEQVYRAGDPNTNGSTDPTHSQLAKDHDNHPFHTLAASLAKEAVSKVGAAMAARWQGDATADPGASAAGFLVHPFDCTWQDQAIVTWAKGHAKQVKRGESSTEWIALRKEHEKEVRDAIKKAGDRSAELWGYINENYDKLFGEKNQVKK